jgi:hypothetical protein
MPLSQECSESETTVSEGSRRKPFIVGAVVSALLATAALFAVFASGHSEVARIANTVQLYNSHSGAAQAAQQDEGAVSEPIPAAGAWNNIGGTGPSETCPFPNCNTTGGICCGPICCSQGSICCNNEKGLCCAPGGTCCGNVRCCAATQVCGQVFANDPVFQEPQCGSGQQF